MKTSTFISLLLSIVVLVVALPGVALADEGCDTTVVRVYYPDEETGTRILISFDAAMLETNYEEKYHVMSVTPEEMDLLVAAGLQVEVYEDYVPLAQPRLGAALGAIPGYSCYETVEETFSEAQGMVNNYPNLAAWIDVGNSWEKSAGIGGYDMMVLKLTNKSIGGDKPIFFATCAIHAREYSTAPLCLTFAHELVDSYGTDADATWILDHHEVHLMLQANPDGRKKAEAGASWRKNTNQNYCGPTSSNRGADLNRNFPFKWACCGGSSGNECDATYRGPSAGSEPETQAVINYGRSVFPDQRGTSDYDAAPDDATGVYIDFHSYGELVLWPWGWTSTHAPNHTQLQTLGRKFAFWNDHDPQQAIGLYPTDGTTDGWGYGELGVASYCFELGTSFFQSCSYYQSSILPGNLPAMWYAAKVARTPYMTPAGPETYNLAISQDNVPAGTNVTLSARLSDNRYSNNNGTEPSQDIAAAEYYIDTPPWEGGASAISMSSSDGSFNEVTEDVQATVDTSGLGQGKHILFIRGRDTNNNWGAFSAIFLTIVSGTPEPTATPDPNLVFFDDFETDQGWQEDPYGTDTATTGMWERANPEGVDYSGITMQLGDAYSGSYDLVTQAAAGSSAGSYDIDGGVTSVRSPAINLPGGNGYTLSFRYYLAHYNNSSSDDFLRVKVVGSSTSTVFEELGAANDDSATWALEEVDVSGFAGQTVRILIEAADAGSGSLVEAGIDDVKVMRTGAAPTDTPPPPTDTPTVEPTDTPPPPPTATPGPDIFFDDFETDQGWQEDPYGTDTATTGMWERANPEPVEYSGVTMQLGDTYSGYYDLVTQAAAGSSAGSYDIDGGVTSIRSPVISLGSGEITLSFRYYLAHYSNGSSDDFLRVKVVGDTTQTVFEELASGDNDDAVWDLAQVDISSFGGQTVRILIEAADAGSGSLIEAGIDDLRVSGQSGPQPTDTPPPPTDTPGPGGFQDDFETDKGWQVDPSGTDTATTGLWERANPEGTEYSGTVYQLGTTASGSYDLVTGPLAGSGVGSYDIDGGVTTIQSPSFTVPSGADLSFAYYLAHHSNGGSDDYLRVKVVGTTTETVFEETASADVDGAVWETFSTSLSGFAGQEVTLLIEAADGGSGSLIEAGIDDVLVE